MSTIAIEVIECKSALDITVSVRDTRPFSHATIGLGTAPHEINFLAHSAYPLAMARAEAIDCTLMPCNSRRSSFEP